MAFRTILIAMVAVGFVFTGCVKKAKEAPPAVKAEKPAVKKDTGDVFKEFYKDSALAADTVSKTFSLNTPESYAPNFSRRGLYVVQVSSLPSRTLASELTTEFKEKGYPAYMTEVENPGSLQGTFYRVRIGGFVTAADAKAFGENILKPGKYDYWIDLKRNEGKSVEPKFNDNAPAPSQPSASSMPPSSPPPSVSTMSNTTTSSSPLYTPKESIWTTPPSSSPAAAPATPSAPPQPSLSQSSSTPSAASNEAPSPDPSPAPTHNPAPSPAPAASTPSGTTGSSSAGWHDTSSIW
jgi:hypothetical protein